MNIEELKQGQAVWVKGIITDIEEDEILDLEIHTSENNFCVNSSDVYASIDQPKLEVPQFVVDWVNDSRERYYDFDEWFEYNNQPREVYEWLNPENKRQADLNALALFTLIINGPDAVTVKKEKSYQIIDKRLNATFSCLGYDIEGRAWFWGNKKFFKKNKGVRLAHTRQQLIDAGFEEVFENPNYEAEEVTE